ncbi:MAG: Toxin-antitoxin biofilm protein TabA [Firmicutes bacterium ADurb.Bin080]|nr:MAG: Toxin-antitoxin biofilm protein TabA [Firmicutes bacterium ADurb.Bin080]
MIRDKIENIGQYEGSHPLFRIAFAYLKNYQGAEVGKYHLDNGVFAMVQRYTAKQESECTWEAHKKYIDIQYIVSGQETICTAYENNLTITVPYNPEKDISFYEGEGTRQELNGGEFLILFPWDTHKPGIGEGNVEKIVVKIPY